VVGVTNVASAETYSLTDLGIVGIGSSANAINNAGQVVGYSQTQPTGGANHATLWNGTAPTDLGTLPGEGGKPGGGSTLSG
jgi:probable HAF family extracellular repeat protein